MRVLLENSSILKSYRNDFKENKNIQTDKIIKIDKSICHYENQKDKIIGREHQQIINSQKTLSEEKKENLLNFLKSIYPLIYSELKKSSISSKKQKKEPKSKISTLLEKKQKAVKFIKMDIKGKYIYLG